MRRTIVGVVVVLVFLSSLLMAFNVEVAKVSDSNINTYVDPESEHVGIAAIASADNSSDDWPMFHHDLSNTGHSTSTAPNTNRILWKSYYICEAFHYQSPSVADGKVYLVSIYYGLDCFDALTGTRIWNNSKTGGSWRSIPAVSGKRVYVGTNWGLDCLDALNGTIIWSYEPGPGTIGTSPAVVSGRVYFGAADGNVYCFNAITGEKLWNYTTGDSVYSSPAVVDGRVYIGSEDHNVYCLNATSGDKIWLYTTEGTVGSSPAVADGRVYVGSGDGNVYCLNATSGDKNWNYTTGDWIWSSPAVADGRVYVGSGDGNVYCLNATSGDKNWNYYTTDYGVSSSPAVADGKVYVIAGDVYCLSAVTGKKIWWYNATSKADPAVAGGVLYFGNTRTMERDGYLCAISDWEGDDWPMFQHDLTRSGYSTSSTPDQNYTVWTYTAGPSSSSPAMATGRIYFGSDDTVYCLNAFTGELVWKYTITPWYLGGFQSPAVNDDRVYVGAHGGGIYCLDAHTGEFIWSYMTEDLVSPSPAVANGRVYIGSWDDWFYCLNASNGELVWKYKTGYDISMSSAAVADGRVYVGSQDKQLYCLDASTGTLIWNYTMGGIPVGRISSSPAVADGRVYVGSDNQRVYCFNASTGAHIWNYPTQGAVISSPAVVNGRLYVGSGGNDGRLYCLNATTGVQIWNYKTDQAVTSSPAVADGRVYVGSDDYNVYCFDALTGALVWKYKTGWFVRSSPAIAGGQVYVGSMDGTLYAFGALTCTGTLWVPDQYPTIQAAIDAACDGAVINVVAKSEPYYEQINIYKSVTLIGHDMPAIDGGDSGTFVNITRSGVSFSGFKIQCLVPWESGTDEYGIVLAGISNCTIEHNYFNGTRYGITLEDCSNIKIFNNHFVADMDICIYVFDGITIRNSFNNQISENEIDVTHYGILISGINSYDNTATYNLLKAFGIVGKGICIEEDAHDNTVSYNEMLSGPTCFHLKNARDNVVSNNRFMAGGLVVSNSSGNLIFHNSFAQEPRRVWPPISGTNAWSLGFPMGGNYWIFHESPDVMTGQYQNLSGSDAIGEKVYELGPGNIDWHPLKGHSYMFPVRFKSVDYLINVISNSTISDLQIDPAESVITLQANGSEGTGFCRVGIPGNLTFDPYTVYVNGVEVSYTTPYSISTIYFTYNHVTQEERARQWPMFQNDLTRSGYSTSSAPAQNFSLWTYTADGLISSSPAVVSGKIYFGSQDKNVYCLNASTGTKMWNYTTGGTVNSPAVVGDRVYVGSTGDRIYCLDASTGALIWNYTAYAGDSSPAVVDGRVYVGAGDGWFYCLDASTGELEWKFESLAGFEMSSAAVVDGRVYVGSMDNKLYCLDASTGTEIWNYTTGDLIYSSPAVADGKIYVGSADHKVYCLDAFTGALIWNYSTGDSIASSPAVADNRVYIGSADWHANVYCLNATTGAQIWNYTTGQAVHSSPAVSDGRVYVGSYDDNVYCFDALTGALIWKYETGGYVLSSPAIADGRAYVGSFDGTLYAFGGPTISLPADVNGTIYTVSVVSNSFISDFSFDESLRTISFSSSGTPDTPAFFNLTFPTILLRGPFTVLEDGSPLAPIETYAGTLTFLYAEYMNALHTIEVIGTTTITESQAISVDPLTINFPQNYPIDWGTERIRTTITNIGGEPLTIESITLILNEGDTYAIEAIYLPGRPAFIPTEPPFTLTSGKNAYVQIGFDPNDMLPFMGTLQIVSDDPINMIVEVSLFGSGGPPSCPPLCTGTVSWYTTDEEGEWWVEIPVGGTITETLVSSIFNILQYNIDLIEHDQGLLVNGTLEHPYLLGQMRLEVKSRNSTEKTSFYNIIITPFLPVVRVYPVNWDGYSFDVTILSNSTISNFAFSQPEKRITFDITVPANMAGYCNVTIPIDLLGGPYICLLDGSPVTVIETSNSTHASLYFDYTHDGYIQITGTTVIPEFPTTITTLLLLAFLSLALLLCRRAQNHITNKTHEVLPY